MFIHHWKSSSHQSRAVTVREYQELLKEKDEQWRTNLKRTIQKIQKARNNFLKDVSVALAKVSSIKSTNCFLGFDKESEQSRIIREICQRQIQLWNSQEEKCRSLEMKWNCEVPVVKSISDLRRLNEKMAEKFEEIGFVESCNLFIKQSGNMDLESIKMSPCARNTTVTTKKEYIVNEVSTCTVIVRNGLGNLVGTDIVYHLSVILVDGQDNPVNITIENEKNGNYNINFFPISTDWYKLFVAINSIPVPGTPFELCVTDPSFGNPGPIVFGEPGIGEGQFARPWGVCCDSYGRIYVADRCNHRVQIFDEKGNFFGKFGREGSDPGEFNRPTGIAADLYQRIIVADKDNHRIQIFQSNGKYINHFGRYESEEENLHYPWDVAVDNYCRIAVTEGKKKRVRLFSDKGDRLAECLFTVEIKLNFPRGIASLADGSFLVTDFEKHKIVLLNSDFKATSTLGSKGKNAEEFLKPQGIAVSRDGVIAVCDYKNKRIKLYRENRLQKIITDFFETPQGIAFHSNGSLIVVDSTKTQVQIFSFDQRIYPSDECFANSEWANEL